MKVLINDQLIEYKDEGSGRVLLLLHGWGTSLSTFDQMTEHLSKKFRVVRFDFPGFGQSPKPSDNWTVDDYAKITRDLLAKLKINNTFVVIGHSFGGRIIIKSITNQYINPQKVILIGSAGIKLKINLKKIIYKTVAKAGKLATSMPVINKLQPYLRRRLYDSAGSSDYINAKQMQKIFINVINEDLTLDIKNINQPTQLIWGENDLETPPTDAEKILSMLPNGKLDVISGAGHFVYLDAFDEVVQKIDRFLS